MIGSCILPCETRRQLQTGRRESESELPWLHVDT
jgi:hypothetical protein